jgi:hypothetical protein
MPPQTIESRVEKLEKQIVSLQGLPERIEGLSAQISQLREDLGAKISQQRADWDARLSQQQDDWGARLAATETRLAATETRLREEIVAGDERILGQVRVLHEDVVSRLALIQESQPRTRKRRT